MCEKKPRIGRQVSHYDMVDIDSIKANFSNCKTYRYHLKFDYLCNQEDLFDQNDAVKNKILTIVMKNPSSADEKAADKTIRNVQTYVYKHFKDVLTVNILNLFSIRATDAKEVDCLYKQNDEDYVNGSQNDKYIKQSIKEADYIIIAWGGRSSINRKLYDKRIDTVKSFIKNNKEGNTKIYRVNTEKGSDLYPFHPTYWGMKFDKTEVSL